jgi:hypothetical protein
MLAFALSLIAATYHAYARRKGMKVGSFFYGPTAPMSLAGTISVLLILAVTLLGRGWAAAISVVLFGTITNWLALAVVGTNIQTVSLLMFPLALATIWYSGIV